jgi:hypothetical protein
MRKISLFLISVLCFNFSDAQILINEYSCSNTNTILNSFNEYDDWVEIYNAGGAAVNLTGYYLSDDPAEPMKWQIPTVAPVNAGARKNDLLQRQRCGSRQW